MYWIKHRRNEDIPQEFYYPEYRTIKEKYGRTPLMMWIENRPGEDIPKCLYYDGWQTDKD